MILKHYLSGVLLFLAFTYSLAQDSDLPAVDISNGEPEVYSGHEDFKFFGSDDILEMELAFDIKKFIKTKSQPENINAVLTVRVNATDSLSQAIKIKARGEMRRKYCSFPPIMLKFKDGNDQGPRIQGKGNLKLVTHCNKSEMFESYVFREYMAYKLYSLVTPYSFRTRLVRIHYVDSRNPKQNLTAYGFLIENEDELAKRNRAIIVENESVSQKHMNDQDMARVALFNFMIGNTDWSVLQQHNIKVLMPVDSFTDKGIPVAYDFDYSGFVKTAYSAPTKNLPIKTVTERYYLGMCISQEELEPVIAEFDALKDRFLNTITDFDYLSASSKKKLEYYINGFYKEYKNQNVLISQLNRTCRR